MKMSFSLIILTTMPKFRPACRQILSTTSSHLCDKSGNAFDGDRPGSRV